MQAGHQKILRSRVDKQDQYAYDGFCQAWVDLMEASLHYQVLQLH